MKVELESEKLLGKEINYQNMETKSKIEMGEQSHRDF